MNPAFYLILIFISAFITAFNEGEMFYPYLFQTIILCCIFVFKICKQIK